MIEGEAMADLTEIWKILASGGPVMIPLFLLSVLLYYQAFRLLLLTGPYRRAPTAGNLPPSNSADAPERILAFTRERSTQHALRQAMGEVRLALLTVIERRLRFLAVLVSCAPLLGLLGTVIGMLETFGGISQGGGPDTSNAVADGISEALVTTQAGLTVALPGLLLVIVLQRRYLAIESLLAFIESRLLLQLRHEPSTQKRHAP